MTYPDLSSQVKQESPVQTDIERPSDLTALVSPSLDEAFYLDTLGDVKSNAIVSWSNHIPFGQWLIATLRPRFVVEIGPNQSIIKSSILKTVNRLHLDTVFSNIAAADAEIGRQAFSDGSIDLMHVTHLGLDQEFQSLFLTWKPKLSQRAVVVIHRSVDDSAAKAAWSWLEARNPHFEFIHAQGLGIAAVGSEVPPDLVPLFTAAKDGSAGRFRNRFAILGKACSENAQIAEARQLKETMETLCQTIRQEQRKVREGERARQQIAFRLGIVRRDLYESQLQSGAIRAERDLAIQERDTIISSRAWAVTTRLIRLAVRFPRISRWGWRFTRLAWWTVTLQLFRRLREWRTIRATLAVQARAATPTPASAPKTTENISTSAVKSERSLNGYLASEAEAAAQIRADYLSFVKGEERLTFPTVAKPQFSVIVTARAPAYGLLHSLKMLRDCASVSFEIIVVSAASDETVELLSRIDGITARYAASSEGLVQAVNQTAKEARGQFLVFIEDSAFVNCDSLKTAQQRLSEATVGAITGRILRTSGLVWEAGGMIWSNGELAKYGEGLSHDQGEVMFRRHIDFTGSTLLITQKETFDRVGGLDESYTTFSYGYADYAMRLSDIDLAVTYEPQLIANIVVLDHEKTALEVTRKDCQRLVRQHGASLSSFHLPAYAQNSLAGRSRKSANSKRLLMIDNELPYRALGSGYPRANEMLCVAAELGWSVTLFPLRRSDFDWDSARLELPLEIEIIKRHGPQALRDLLEERKGYYQVILVSRPDNMEVFQDTVRDTPEFLLGAKLVYDAEAVFTKRELVRAALEGNPYSNDQAAVMLDAEAKIANGADSITCVTEAEKEFFSKRHDMPVHVISHSVRQSSRSPEFSEREGFLFIGRLLEPTAPNWMGLKWFIDTCWPVVRNAIPDATLTVIGHLHPGHAELAQPGILLLGAIDDLSPYYDKAKIFVAPIRFAAGVPIKILEAAAAGLPVAGTALMAEQMLWTPGVEIMADDDPTRLAKACVDVYESAAAWNMMRENAQAQISQTYSPEAFRQNLDAVLSGRPDSASHQGDFRPSLGVNRHIKSESAPSV
ncbi:glycosyltransferase involved in cell wall biosynthesis [Paraburkholderia sp. GAS206C]